jgi:type VI secretion system protein ImpL
VTRVLSGPTSPLVNILNSISDETRLTEDRSNFNTSGLADGAQEIGVEETKNNISFGSQIALETLLSSSAQTGSLQIAEPGAYVEDRFKWLHELLTQVDEQSLLDQLIESLTEVYLDLNKKSFAGDETISASEVTSTLHFLDLAKRMPDPIIRWASQIVSGSSAISADGTRGSINARWQAQVLPLCKQALNGRYPFARSAQSEVGLQDFERLFGPSGLIDTFFNDHLVDYVDKSVDPWAWKLVNNADLGISTAVLKQMQNASEIRDAFFTDGPQPSVKFQLIPEALDDDAKSVTLEIDGQVITFEQKQPLRPFAITWPGDIGQAAVAFRPELKKTGNELRRNGPWAWFRLLNAATMRATNASDRTRIIFNVGGRISIFQMQSGSVLNPFALPALSEFTCPSSF